MEPAEAADTAAVLPAMAAPQVPQLSPAACAELLKQHFPALFTGGVKPLKLRIQADIQQRAPGVFSKGALSAFFRRHTGATSYLIALSKAPQRFDLDGQPAGELSDEHRQLAREELDRRRQLRNEREQQARAAQRQQAPQAAGEASTDGTAGTSTPASPVDGTARPERRPRADAGPRPDGGPRPEGGQRPDRGPRPPRPQQTLGDDRGRARPQRPPGDRMPGQAPAGQADRPRGDNPRQGAAGARPGPDAGHRRGEQAHPERQHTMPAAPAMAAASAETAEERQARQDREARRTLLRDFDRSPFTLANFCVLKGLKPEALAPLLEQARKEAAAEPKPTLTDAPRGPQGPRHDDRRPNRPGDRGERNGPRPDTRRPRGPGQS